MTKVESEEPAVRTLANADTSRFADLWAISDAEITKGMETLDLDDVNEEVARRRGR